MVVSLCWFRRDLRLDDNPAWSAATAAGPVLPVYVLEPDLIERAGPHRRRQFVADLRALADTLTAAGGHLHVVSAPAATALPAVADAVGATAIHANADVTPYAAARDAAADATRPITWHWGGLVHPPGSILTRKGTLSQVFTPFYNRWAEVPVAAVDTAGPVTFAAAPEGAVPLPEPDAPPPLPAGTEAARDRLAAFLEVVDEYPDRRDLPAEAGTSELSSDLRFGTVGPREILDAVGTATPGRQAFVRQLAWRDWYAHMLHEQPRIVSEAVRPDYDRIQWRHDPQGLAAWKAGRTGYPLVDAGMRQLATTGWMHNRVRMVVASFLVKDLLIDWVEGERWFRHLLIDGDVAQNVGNWQWAAGTGNDAAPYFRIFNPVTQSARFDPDGEYIRRWVPELVDVDRAHIHAPWEAPPLELAAAGVVLGDTYPAPIVDHSAARDRTLAAYKLALG